MKRVCVFTIDLMKSRELTDRRAVQMELLNMINTLNSRFKSELLAKFMIVLGDEFQGVLKSSEKALEVFRFVKKNLPVEFYCGVGVGNINTSLSDNPLEMDGPAFYRSRDALEEAKKKRFEGKLYNIMKNVREIMYKYALDSRSLILMRLSRDEKYIFSEALKLSSSSEQGFNIELWQNIE